MREVRPDNAGRSALAAHAWKPGQSGNPSGLTRERRALYEAIERAQIPKVIAMLDALFERGLEGDDAASRLWLDQVRGPLKAREQDEIDIAVERRVIELVSAAKRAKMAANEGTYDKTAMGESDRSGREDDRKSLVAAPYEPDW